MRYILISLRVQFPEACFDELKELTRDTPQLAAGRFIFQEVLQHAGKEEKYQDDKQKYENRGRSNRCLIDFKKPVLKYPSQ